MMHGVPVVTTSIGTQGMHARVGEDIMVGDTPQEFANCVTRVLQDRELWNVLSRNGQDLVRRSYSFEAVVGQIEKIIENLGTLRIKRYNPAKRLAIKSRLDFADLLDQHLLWRFRRST